MRTGRRQPKRKQARARHVMKGLTAWAGVFSLAICVALLAGAYLVQVSATASKGYAIRSLQNEIDGLKAEKEKLEFQVAKDRSMVAVEERVASMGMVPVSEIEYLKASAPIVAKR